MEPLRKADAAQAERLHRFAHDLRNRLGTLKQVLELLASPESATNHPELLALGEAQFFKAMRQVEALLDDLGVERGTRVVHPRPVALDDLLAEAIADQQHRFERKQQVLHPSPSTGLQTLCDPGLTRELVGALLSNASKFSAPGSHVHVEVERQDASVAIGVTDQGIGLDAEDLAQVFVRYALLKGRPTAGEAQGRSTLARARQWAEAMGGQLTAHSRGPGAGCTFRLVLPLAGA